VQHERSICSRFYLVLTLASKLQEIPKSSHPFGLEQNFRVYTRVWVYGMKKWSGANVAPNLGGPHSRKYSLVWETNLQAWGLMLSPKVRSIKGAWTLMWTHPWWLTMWVHLPCTQKYRQQVLAHMVIIIWCAWCSGIRGGCFGIANQILVQFLGLFWCCAYSFAEWFCICDSASPYVNFVITQTFPYE
jgi:hypothetical protein